MTICVINHYHHSRLL